MAKIHPLIHPALVSIIERFPEYNDAVSVLFSSNQSVNEICPDYDKCRRTLVHYQKQDSAEARQRLVEYGDPLRT